MFFVILCAMLRTTIVKGNCYSSSKKRSESMQPDHRLKKRDAHGCLCVCGHTVR